MERDQEGDEEMDKLKDIVYSRLKADFRNLPEKKTKDALDKEIERLQDSAEERLERIFRHVKIKRYKKRAIYSGDMVEYEIYPIWSTNSEVRREKTAISKESQKALNALNRRKRVMRLINANFTDEDAWYTFTYTKRVTHEQAEKDADNYLRRLRYKARKMGFELKNICVVESTTSRTHIHLICNFRNRDVAEKMWTYGRTEGQRLQPDEDGLTALAIYLSKECNGKKRYKASRNLVKPTIKEVEITEKTAKKAIRSYDSAEQELKRLFKDYDINGIDLRENPYCRGTYMYSRLKRRQKNE